MAKSAKSWMSFTDQLALLEARGLLVEDKAAALDYLERIGYYRLAGYWYPLRQIKAQPQGHSLREDIFIPGSRFEEGVRLYVFDKKLRLLALDALERIELAVRVDVAYLLGQHDTFAHKNPSLFHPNFLRSNPRNKNSQSDYDKWLEGFNKLQMKASKTVFVDHNVTEYGDLPIWVAIEIMDFGCLSHLVAGLRYADKMRIANIYRFTDPIVFEKTLRALNFIRNVSAHHSRLWNVNMVDRANLNSLGTFGRALNNYKPFAYFCLIQSFMKVICPNSSWSERFKALMTEFPYTANARLTLYDFGLVDGWDEEELWN